MFCPITCMFVKISADGYTSFIMCVRQMALLVLGCLKQCEVSLTCSYRLIFLCQKEKNRDSRIFCIIPISSTISNLNGNMFLFFLLFFNGFLCVGCILFYKSAFNPNGSPIVEITRFNSWNFHFIPMSIYHFYLLQIVSTATWISGDWFAWIGYSFSILFAQFLELLRLNLYNVYLGWLDLL
jgi:hypothetical protein